MMVGLAAAIVLVLIAYGFYNGERLHDLNSPLTAAAREIRLEANAVRIGIEEMTQDAAADLNPDIWGYLDQSIWYFENLLESGNSLFNQLIPIRNQEIRALVNDLKSRLTDLKNHDALSPDKKIDNQEEQKSIISSYDLLFEAFLSQLDTVEESIARIMNKDQFLFRLSHAALVLFCILLAGVVSLTINRYEKHRSQYFSEIKETNNQLKIEAEERQEAERALQENERLFRTVFETIPDSIIISRLKDNRIIDVNNGFLELTGFSKFEVLGKTPLDLTLWEDTVKRDRFISILESRKYIHNYESSFLVKSGKIQTALLSVHVIEIKGEPHFITVARNISELKEAENALRDSEEKFRGLFEAAADYIYLLDLEGHILLSNPAVTIGLGYSSSEMKGRRLSDYVAPDQRDEFKHTFSGLEIDGYLKCEVNMVSKGGRRVSVDCSASLIRDNAETVDCIVVFQKDVTDRKLVDRKRQASHDFLAIAHRHTNMQPMLKDFIAATKKLTGCQAAAIRIMDQEGYIPYSYQDGFKAEFCEIENMLSVDSDTGLCVKVFNNDIDNELPHFTEHGSFFINDLSKEVNGSEDNSALCIRNNCNRFGYRSLALVPIRLGRQTLGLIHAVDRRENTFSPEKIEILEAAAMQLGATITRLRAEEALKSAYQVLEDRVLERTAELSKANENLKSQIDVRRRAEIRLRDSRNMLQTLIDGITDALILVDRDMRVRMINSGAAQLYGYKSLKDVIGQKCFNAAGIMGACSDCEIPQAVKRGQTHTFERQGLTDDKRLEQVSVYPIKEKNNEIGGAIVRISDITEERRFERQLIQSEKMASLGILVSSIAHEINNPNSFVTFNIPILREYLEELIGIADDYAENQTDLEMFHMTYPEFRKDIFKLIDNIEHGSSRISSFVSNLREFSQSNGNRHKVMLDLPVVVDKVLSICRSQIKKHVKTFEVYVPKNLPPVFADEYSLEQVLLNLIVNAVQASDKRDSYVKVCASSGESWREHTIIEVIDNGCGIDRKIRDRIFDPFFTTKSASEGTGLGLYVCHNLIESLGGAIDVNSRPGEGSTFTVLLPDRDRRKKPRPDGANTEAMITLEDYGTA